MKLSDKLAALNQEENLAAEEFNRKQRARRGEAAVPAPEPPPDPVEAEDPVPLWDDLDDDVWEEPPAAPSGPSTVAEPVSAKRVEPDPGEATLWGPHASPEPAKPPVEPGSKRSRTLGDEAETPPQPQVGESMDDYTTRVDKWMADRRPSRPPEDPPPAPLEPWETGPAVVAEPPPLPDPDPGVENPVTAIPRPSPTERPLTRDPYEVLGISAGASEKEIIAAYRRLAQEWHPDHNHSPEATDRFLELHKAFATISDPSRPTRRRSRVSTSPAAPDMHGAYEAFLRSFDVGGSASILDVYQAFLDYASSVPRAPVTPPRRRPRVEPTPPPPTRPVRTIPVPEPSPEPPPTPPPAPVRRPPAPLPPTPEPRPLAPMRPVERTPTMPPPRPVERRPTIAPTEKMSLRKRVAERVKNRSEAGATIDKVWPLSRFKEKTADGKKVTEKSKSFRSTWTGRLMRVYMGIHGIPLLEQAHQDLMSFQWKDAAIKGLIGGAAVLYAQPFIGVKRVERVPFRKSKR